MQRPTIRTCIKPASLITCRLEVAQYIESTVNDILLGIEDEVERAVSARFSSCRCEIQSCFEQQPGVKKARLERMIYYYVLRSLEDAEYSATITFGGSPAKPRTYLRVTWKTPAEVQEDEYMDLYIRQHAAEAARPESGGTAGRRGRR